MYSTKADFLLKNMETCTDKSNTAFTGETLPMPIFVVSHIPDKLNKTFYDVPCYNLANFLLGKVLVRRIGDDILKGRIVETESYLGREDKASHSYLGRRTATNEPMFMPAGTIYVYIIYGMYNCFNISSMEEGAAVLLRALEPLQGKNIMKELRLRKRKNINANKELKDFELCNGPSKLCISMDMDIQKDTCNKVDICNSDLIWIEHDPTFDNKFKIIRTTRIGIDSCGEEWSKKSLRFYIGGNKCVSKRDRIAEKY